MEKIIIDGVDVAECMFYEKKAVLYDCTEDTTSGDNECYKCKDNPNCYYKQLKRLQVENEQLKEENEEINNRMAEVTYRATGGRLSYSTYTLNAIEQAFYDQLEILSDRKAEEQIEEYKQALEEIREIAENSCDIPCAGHNCDCENCKDEITNNGETCMQYGLDKIINKINEVLND